MVSKRALFILYFLGMRTPLFPSPSGQREEKETALRGIVLKGERLSQRHQLKCQAPLLGLSPQPPNPVPLPFGGSGS